MQKRTGQNAIGDVTFLKNVTSPIVLIYPMAFDDQPHGPV